MTVAEFEKFPDDGNLAAGTSIVWVLDPESVTVNVYQKARGVPAGVVAGFFDSRADPV